MFVCWFLLGFGLELWVTWVEVVGRILSGQLGERGNPGHFPGKLFLLQIQLELGL
jgi:hypothetical protein